MDVSLKGLAQEMRENLLEEISNFKKKIYMNGTIINNPKRIKRQYYKKLPPKSKSVTRPGKWGNPFLIVLEDDVYFVKDKSGNYWGNNNEGYKTKELAAKKSVQCFKGYLSAKVMKGELSLSAFDNIDNIACFCKLEETCHADIIIDFVSQYRNGQTFF